MIEEDSLNSYLDQHERTDDQTHEKGVTGIPLDEIFLIRVAERRVDDELYEPDQNKESAVNNDLYFSQSIHAIFLLCAAATQCPDKGGLIHLAWSWGRNVTIDMHLPAFPVFPTETPVWQETGPHHSIHVMAISALLWGDKIVQPVHFPNESASVPVRFH